MLEIVGLEVDGGWQCILVECGMTKSRFVVCQLSRMQLMQIRRAAKSGFWSVVPSTWQAVCVVSTRSTCISRRTPLFCLSRNMNQRVLICVRVNGLVYEKGSYLAGSLSMSNVYWPWFSEKVRVRAYLPLKMVNYIGKFSEDPKQYYVQIFRLTSV